MITRKHRVLLQLPSKPTRYLVGPNKCPVSQNPGMSVDLRIPISHPMLTGPHKITPVHTLGRPSAITIVVVLHQLHGASCKYTYLRGCSADVDKGNAHQVRMNQREQCRFVLLQ